MPGPSKSIAALQTWLKRAWKHWKLTPETEGIPCFASGQKVEVRVTDAGKDGLELALCT